MATSASSRAPRARARGFGAIEVNAHDPVAEPRCAAGGRSSNIIICVRPERPSSIVAPNQIH